MSPSMRWNVTDRASDVQTTAEGKIPYERNGIYSVPNGLRGSSNESLMVLPPDSPSPSLGTRGANIGVSDIGKKQVIDSPRTM